MIRHARSGRAIPQAATRRVPAQLFRVGYRNLRAPIPPASTVPREVLNQYVLTGYPPQNSGGLGLSLRPPRWLRKAQPGKILKKIAVPLAVTAGALLIPGVAPLALKAVTGAGGLLMRGGAAAARGAGGLFRGAITAIKPKPKIPGFGLPRMGQPGFQYPTAQPAPPVTAPSIEASTQYYDTGQVMAPASYGGGGGGGGGGGEVPMMETGPGPEAGARMLGPGLVVVGGIVALGMIASMASRRRG